jgi:hypothetical protein
MGSWRGQAGTTAARLHALRAGGATGRHLPDPYTRKITDPSRLTMPTFKHYIRALAPLGQVTPIAWRHSAGRATGETRRSPPRCHRPETTAGFAASGLGLAVRWPELHRHCRPDEGDVHGVCSSGCAVPRHCTDSGGQKFHSGPIVPLIRGPLVRLPGSRSWNEYHRRMASSSMPRSGRAPFGPDWDRTSPQRLSIPLRPSRYTGRS